VVVLVGDDQVSAAPLDVLPRRTVLFAAAPVVSPAHSATVSVEVIYAYSAPHSEMQSSGTVHSIARFGPDQMDSQLALCLIKKMACQFNWHRD
jgi:hypothetical protein